MLRAAIVRPCKFKLSVFFGIFVLFVGSCIFAGWFTGKGPYISRSYAPTKCIVENPTGIYEFDNQWHIPKGKPNNQRINCVDAKEVNTSVAKITMDEIVYVFQVPDAARGSAQFSRFVLSVNAYLLLNIVFKNQNASKAFQRSKITYEVKMGYQNHSQTSNNWTMMYETTESRYLHCKLEKGRVLLTYQFGCNFIPFFSLGDDYEHRYLLNVRFPNDFVGESKFNYDIHSVDILKLVLLHPSPEYTRLLGELKLFIYPAACVVWVWFYRCLYYRPLWVIEKSCLFLGFANLLLHLPIDFFICHQYYRDMPYCTYIREMIFFAALTLFYVSFFGQFIKYRMNWRVMTCYFLYLSPLNLYSLEFLSDLYEKFVQTRNPFFSMWDSITGFRHSPHFNLFSAAFATGYLIIVSYPFGLVFNNIVYKQKILYTRGGKLITGGLKAFIVLMFSVYFLLLVTILQFTYCQYLQFTFKVKGLAFGSEEQDPLFTGLLFAVNPLWNFLTFSILAMYAPSQEYPLEEEQEEIEMVVIPQEPQ